MDQAIASKASLRTDSDDPLIPMVFHNPWWLDAATGGTYEMAEVRADGIVVGRLPYVVSREWPGYRVCTMPQLTHSLGWAVDLGATKGPNRNTRHYEITRQLAAQLRPFAGFHHKLHGQVPDTFAFNDAGYSTSVQFTFEIPPQADDVTWRGMRDKTRNVIRRAEERLRVVGAMDPQAFVDLYERNLRSRSLVNTAPRMRHVCSAALAHSAARFFVAEDNHGAAQGAIFIVWDRRTAYYLLSTRSPGAENGAISLLIWHAIRHAHAMGLIFDFDGVGTQGSRLFFTGFGGAIAPRYVLSRYSRGSRVAQTLRDVRLLPGLTAVRPR